MKTGTLLQSLLLAAGLTLGGIPAVQADRPHPDATGHGNYHNVQHTRHGPGHAPWWSSSRHGKHNPKNHGRDNRFEYKHRLSDRHDGHGDRHDYRDRLRHGKHDGHGDWYDHGDRWKYGKYNNRSDGRDHKDYKKHGKHDGRDDAGRKGHRSRSAGIGYTGRS